MDKLKFEFTIKTFEDKKTNVLAVTSITTKEGKIFLVPEELQSIKHHETLMKTETYKTLKITLQRRHEKRCLWITLSDELRKTYMDDDENLQFKNYFLEEVIDKTEITQPTVSEGISEESLSRILEKITNMNPKQTNLKKISEKFVIEKFTGENSNVTQWMAIFEKECDRFEIVEDEKKIEIFRLFLDKSCLNWYSSMLIRLTLTSEWKQWKEDFCDTYENKGWTPIRYAIDFKYKTGSLLDYAIRKERILLEMDNTINKSTLIDLIAVGLPSFITDRIDRKKIKETKDLFNEVKSLEHLVNKKGFDKKKLTNPVVKTKEVKEPCKICKKLNKGKDITFTPNELKEERTENELLRDRNIALKNSIKSHNYNKKLYDRNRKYYEFKVGDMVFAENGNKLNRRKLDELKIGPYEIIEKLSNSIYRINTGHRKSESNLFHITKLVPAPAFGDDSLEDI